MDTFSKTFYSSHMIILFFFEYVKAIASYIHMKWTIMHCMILTRSEPSWGDGVISGGPGAGGEHDADGGDIWGAGGCGFRRLSSSSRRRCNSPNCFIGVFIWPTKILGFSNIFIRSANTYTMWVQYYHTIGFYRKQDLTNVLSFCEIPWDCPLYDIWLTTCLLKISTSAC